MIPRLLAVFGLAAYAAWLTASYRFHFLDHVNLAVHEAGHVLLRPFGMTAHMLGGTLLQLAAPLAFVGSFLLRGRRFDGAVCAVWFAESLMYTAHYMADGYLMRLPLVGGEIHDWNWLLSRWGLVAHAELLGRSLHWVAAALAAGAVTWAGLVCVRDHGRPRVSGWSAPT